MSNELNPAPREYDVSWEITVEADSPEQAAEIAWTQYMHRTMPPETDDACVFTVTERENCAVWNVDLAETNENEEEGNTN